MICWGSSILHAHFSFFMFLKPPPPSSPAHTALVDSARVSPALMGTRALPHSRHSVPWACGAPPPQRHARLAVYQPAVRDVSPRGCYLRSRWMVRVWHHASYLPGWNLRQRAGPGKVQLVSAVVGGGGGGGGGVVLFYWGSAVLCSVERGVVLMCICSPLPMFFLIGGVAFGSAAWKYCRTIGECCPQSVFT